MCCPLFHQTNYTTVVSNKLMNPFPNLKKYVSAKRISWITLSGSFPTATQKSSTVIQFLSLVGESFRPQFSLFTHGGSQLTLLLNY